ncbi:MAG: DNA-binding domain-containing protein [Hyphomicrobiales bacterium]
MKIQLSQQSFVYSLRKATISSKNKASFYPRHHAPITQTHEEIIDECVEKAKLDRTNFLNYLDTFFSVISKNLHDGKSITTQWINCTSTMKGTVEDETDTFNPKNNPKHKVLEHISFAKKLRNKTYPMDLMHFEKIEYHEKAPEIRSIGQIFPKSIDIIERGMSGIINGFNFFCDNDSDAIELFLINAAGEKSKVTETEITSEKSIMFIIDPTVESGDYQVQINLIRPSGRKSSAYYKTLSVV